MEIIRPFTNDRTIKVTFEEHYERTTKLAIRIFEKKPAWFNLSTKWVEVKVTGWDKTIDYTDIVDFRAEDWIMLADKVALRSCRLTEEDLAKLAFKKMTRIVESRNGFTQEEIDTLETLTV